VFIGCADDISFCAVLCKGLAAMGFAMDEGLHATGYKQMAVVVVVSVEVSVCGDLWVCIGLM
jgi:hypothetical protein